MIRRRVLRWLWAFEDLLEPGAEHRTITFPAGRTVVGGQLHIGRRVVLRGRRHT